MSDQRNGGIAWTDRTWNPTRGCSRVSAGCEHCYAEGVARRFSGPGLPYEGLVRLTADGKAKAQWNGVVRLVPERLGDPVRWRHAQRIFVNSMSDLFHEALSFEDIAAVFGVMASAHWHTFQVLTKRPKRALEFFAWVADQGAELVAGVGERPPPGGGEVSSACWLFADRVMPRKPQLPSSGMKARWPLPNVHVLVSVEDQATADHRIPLLLTLPAAVHGISYEPALGPVALRHEWMRSTCEVHDSPSGFCSGDCAHRTAGLDWVIVGGESGPGARPFDLWWAREAVAQCRAAGVPVFVKQLGARPVAPVSDPEASNYGERLPVRLSHRAGADMAEWPLHLQVRELPR